MSKCQTLRALVNERLTAAIEEIFALFEKTIHEYEEELSRSKKENQLLRSTRVHRGGTLAQTLPTSPGTDLNQEITESQIKAEPSVKQEEDLLPVCLPQFSTVGVKREESSLLEQRQTEHRGDISSQPHFQSEIEGDTELSSETDNNQDLESQISWSAEQLKTEADEGHYNRVQIKDSSKTLSPQNIFAPETRAINNGNMSGISDKIDISHCSVCERNFTSLRDLQIHLSVHTGEKLYSCPICKKNFTRKFRLEGHMRTHTSEKPFSCSLCQKTFGRKDCLRNHMRTHTGEKPFSCPICNKAFADQSNLAVHRRIHTGERPYICLLCHKSYGHKGCLRAHMRTHTGEKLHSCSLCGKKFGKKGYLEIHMRCHTGEKPYICPICCKAFSVNSNLTRHMKSHEEEKPTGEQEMQAE